MKGRASTFSRDREEAKSDHRHSPEAWGRKAVPYSAEKYERGLEERQQQEYDRLDAAEEDYSAGDANDQ